MANKLFDNLYKELKRAKEENPVLVKDPKLKAESESNELLEKSLAEGKYAFEHNSHNSHGDWGKHWAQGGYEDDDPQDDTNTPIATP